MPGCFQFHQGYDLFASDTTNHLFTRLLVRVPFSAIAIDRAHKQCNAQVKIDGGAVGLTENPPAFKRWMLAGPEVCRIIEQFEVNANNKSDSHNEQTTKTQAAFVKEVKDFAFCCL